MPRPKKLKQLLIDRVDLVDKGDNPEARLMLFKRDGGDEEGLIDKIVQKISALLNIKKGADQVFELKKFLEGLEEADRKGIEDELAKATALEEELRKAKEELEDEKKKQEEKPKPKPKEDEEDEVMKALPEAVRKMVEDARNEAEEAKKVAKALKEETLVREYVAKAQELRNLSVKADEVGPILKRIADSSAEDYAKVEAMLKAADEAIARNNLLVKELGVAGGGESSGGAWGKIEAKASELVSKSTTGLTKEQAIAKVLNDDQKLYAEYRKELQEVR